MIAVSHYSENLSDIQQMKKEVLKCLEYGKDTGCTQPVSYTHLFGLTIPSMLLYVLALAGPLLLGTLPASFYNWNLIKGNKDFVGLEMCIRDR